MIIATSNDTSHINLEAARQREINVCNTPGLNSGNREHIQQICNQVINNINAWLKKQAINPVT